MARSRRGVRTGAGAPSLGETISARQGPGDFERRKEPQHVGDSPTAWNRASVAAGVSLPGILGPWSQCAIRESWVLSMKLLSVAAGVPPAVEGGVPPPGIPFQVKSVPPHFPPGKMPGSTAGETPTATTCVSRPSQIHGP